MSHPENESTHTKLLDQATLACLVERAGELVTSFDSEFRILYANSNARKILRRYSKDFYGCVIWDFFPEAIGKPTHQQYLRAMRDRVPVDFEEKSEVLGRWFEHRCLPTNDGGMLALVRDVTQRQEALEQLRHSEEAAHQNAARLQHSQARLLALIENLPGGILVEDEERCVLHINQAFCDLFNLSLPPAALLGACCRAVAQQIRSLTAYPDSFSYNLEQIIARKEPVTGREIILADGRILERDYMPVQVEGFYLGHLWHYRDITERKRMEQELRDTLATLQEREAQLRALSDNLPDAAVFQVSSTAPGERRFLYFSEGIEPLTGIPVAEILKDARVLYSRIFPEDSERLAQLEEKALRNSTEFAADVRLRAADGGLRWLRLHSRPRALPDGGKIWDGVQLDITERKQLEENLNIALDRYEIATEGTQSGVWDFDYDTQIWYRSPSLWKILGYSDVPEAERPARLFHLIHPEDSPRTLSQFEQFLKSPAPLFEAEFRVYRRDGLWRWMLCRATAGRREDGSARRVTGIFTDVTDRRESDEERLRYQKLLAQLAENFPDIFYITDMQTGKKKYINHRFTQIFGYSPEEVDSLNHQFFAQLRHPDDKAQVAAFEAQRDALKDGEFAEVEYRLRDKKGDWRWVHRRESIFSRDKDGVVVQIFGIAQDVTARKQAEERKDARLAEAESHAERDALTGLYNRRAFLHRLQQETEDAAVSTGETPLTVALLDLDSFKFFNDVYGHLEGDTVLRNVADALRSCCRETDMLARLGGDEFAALFPGLGREGAERRITRMKEVIAQLGYRPTGHSLTSSIPIALSGGVAVMPDDGITPAAALRMADERLYQDKIRQRESWSEVLRSDLSVRVKGFAMLDALVTSVDCKDRYTRLHSEDVLVYALQIAEELALSHTEQETLKVAALLHDVGKIGVPERILRQPGSLPSVDFEAIKQHADLGAIIVGAVPGLEETLPAIRHHHERWDGNGYPHGLVGEDIPFMARVLAIADAFSAMTTDRPYRPGMSVEDALYELERGAGIQWDPACVAAFLRFRHRTTE